MMYNQKLVASLKANGKILREFKDTVYIPFGSEYSIVVKNLNTVRAIVNITLDGSDVCPGGLVVTAGQTIDLERWIKNGNMNEGNRFKFIERTNQIEQHRGIGLEDGIINITYQFESLPMQATTVWDYNTGHWEKEEKWKFVRDSAYKPYNNILRGFDAPNIGSPLGSASVAQDLTSKSKGQVSAQSATLSYNETGITVPGSISDQKFCAAAWFPVLLEKHSIVLKMLGETPDNKPILTPVTVSAKPKCTSCGKLNKANSKFCSQCGTALTLI